MKQWTKLLFASMIVGIALFVFATTLIRAYFHAPEEEVPLPSVMLPSAAPPPPSHPYEMPRRLAIPSIGIDARVQHVGINASGNMAAPSNFSDVGWYRYGSAPGQVGSAVIAGHVDNGLGLSGVFRRLQEVRTGDVIFIMTEQGTQLRFAVSEIASYPYNEVPSELLFNRTDKARLNLITCGGRWLAGQGTYDRRLVIYAELIE